MDEKKLIQQAIDAKKNSYSPYSNFPVGCALALKDGTYIKGANIENASFGATNCAERSAIFAAYSQGYNKDDILAIAISSNLESAIAPCSICRQVMVELLSPSTPVYMTKLNGEAIRETVSSLVPYSFTEEELRAGQNKPS